MSPPFSGLKSRSSRKPLWSRLSAWKQNARESVLILKPVHIVFLLYNLSLCKASLGFFGCVIWHMRHPLLQLFPPHSISLLIALSCTLTSSITPHPPLLCNKLPMISRSQNRGIYICSPDWVWLGKFVFPITKVRKPFVTGCVKITRCHCVVFNTPITSTPRSKARAIFAPSNTGIVGSNPTW
jgi:hypothetical protein